MFERLGLQHAPWFIRIYLILVLLFGILVLVSIVPPASGLWMLASEGLKTTLAALLGALSVAGERLRGDTRA